MDESRRVPVMFELLGMRRFSQVVILAPEDSALTLAQLRIVRSLLQKHFSSERRVWMGVGVGAFRASRV